MARWVNVQASFIDAIRSPEKVSYQNPDHQRRMKIYQELFFNNVEGFLRSSFPVLRSVLSESQWLRLARQFFREHRCESPYFIHISRSFVDYLHQSVEAKKTLPPFTADLAHYEWIEVDMSTRKTPPASLLDMQQLASTRVALSSCAEVLSYAYPVHQIAVHNQPTEMHDKDDYHYLIYRNTEHDVKFVVLTALTATFLRQFTRDTKGVILSHLAQTSLLQLPTAQQASAAQGIAEVISLLVNECLLCSVQA